MKRGIALEKIVIRGGNKLTGEVDISGAKNSVVAIIPATLLAQGVCRIENIPDISDVVCMLRILSQMGAEIKYINLTLYFNLNPQSKSVFSAYIAARVGPLSSCAPLP